MVGCSSFESKRGVTPSTSPLEPSIPSSSQKEPRRYACSDELHNSSIDGCNTRKPGLPLHQNWLHPGRILRREGGCLRSWVWGFLVSKMCARAVSCRMAQEQGRKQCWLLLKETFQHSQKSWGSWVPGGCLPGPEVPAAADRCPGSAVYSWPSTPCISWLSASDHPAVG